MNNSISNDLVAFFITSNLALFVVPYKNLIYSSPKIFFCSSIQLFLSLISKRTCQAHKYNSNNKNIFSKYKKKGIHQNTNYGFTFTNQNYKTIKNSFCTSPTINSVFNLKYFLNHSAISSFRKAIFLVYSTISSPEKVTSLVYSTISSPEKVASLVYSTISSPEKIASLVYSTISPSGKATSLASSSEIISSFLCVNLSTRSGTISRILVTLSCCLILTSLVFPF